MWLKMVGLDLLLYVSYYLSLEAFGTDPSRRLNNLPFVLYQSCLSFNLYLVIYVADRLFLDDQLSTACEAINYN